MTEQDNTPDSVEIVNNHLEQFFEEDDILVLHEKESKLVHTDIFIIKANEERRYNLLLTCGLSALPMHVPEEMDDWKFAELVLLLPPDWNLEYESFEDENNYWPIRALKQLSKHPHLEKTWLGYGHTFILDDEYKTKHRFHSVILLESITLSEDFTYIEDERKEVYIYAVIPLYEEEYKYKWEQGTEKLLEKFEQFNIDEIVDINRPNVCL